MKKTRQIAITTMYCHLRLPDAIAFPTSCGASNLSCIFNSLSFHLESLWGTTLMPLRECVMDWGQNEILKISKNSGLI